MALSVTRSDKIFFSQFDWLALPVTVYDSTPDPLPILNIYAAGAPLNARVIAGSSIRIPRKLYPNLLSYMGIKSDGTKVYIALNVDLLNVVVFNLYAVDETGGSSGGGDGQARIAGTVTIDGVPAARDVIVISDNATGRKVVGAGTSDGTGAFDITYDDWDGAVIALALDLYGSAFVPSAPINLGAVVHPTAPNGYVYEVTSAGTTGEDEPTWTTGSSVTSGSVTFNPRPYYRPVASGPLQGEIITPP